MNQLHELGRRVVVNPFTNYDAFHCLSEEEGGCEFCPFCGVAERHDLAGRFSGRSYQGYKAGFERWKDWDDVKEVYAA